MTIRHCSVCLFAGMTDPQMRAMICSLKPKIIISESEGTWHFRMVTPHSTRVDAFVSGQEIDSTSVVGKPVKVSDGNGRRGVVIDLCGVPPAGAGLRGRWAGLIGAPIDLRAPLTHYIYKDRSTMAFLSVANNFSPNKDVV